MTPSNVSGTTTPVPSDQDYQAPVNTKSRIADKFRRLAEVEVIGRDGQPRAVTPVVGGPDPITASDVDASTSVTPSGSHTPVPTPGGTGTLVERMRQKAQLQLDQPIPPGSTTV